MSIGHDETGLWVRYAPTASEPEGPLVVYRGVPASVAAKIANPDETPSIGAALHNLVRGQYEAEYPNRPEAPVSQAPEPSAARRAERSGKPAAAKGRRQRW